MLLYRFTGTREIVFNKGMHNTKSVDGYIFFVKVI
jgi:hypothetical protein